MGSRGGSRGKGAGGAHPPPHPWDDLQFSNTSGVLRKKKTMWFIGVEVEQETSAPPPKKNPGSAPGQGLLSSFIKGSESVELTSAESILNVWPVTAYIRMRVDPWDVLNHTNWTSFSSQLSFDIILSFTLVIKWRFTASLKTYSPLAFSSFHTISIV